MRLIHIRIVITSHDVICRFLHQGGTQLLVENESIKMWSDSPKPFSRHHDGLNHCPSDQKFKLLSTGSPRIYTYLQTNLKITNLVGFIHSWNCFFHLVPRVTLWTHFLPDQHIRVPSLWFCLVYKHSQISAITHVIAEPQTARPT